MGALMTLLLFTMFGMSGPQPQYTCQRVPPTRVTQWGHNHALIDFSDKTVKSLKGSVRTGDRVVEDVLVEILELGSSEHRPAETAEDARSRRRIAACMTGAAGRFEFALPTGRYELLASKPDWNSTSAIVSVDTRMGKRRDIVIPLRVGD